MKLTWGEILNLVLAIIKIVKEVLKAESLPKGTKHEAVKSAIMPYILKKGWHITGDDIDKLINDTVYWIKVIRGL